MDTCETNRKLKMQQLFFTFAKNLSEVKLHVFFIVDDCIREIYFSNN